MSLILSGSEGLSDVDGTAATPAIRGTDTNTGIFFPAADTIAFAEGGVESMRLDSSGNLGIGTTSLSNGVRTVIQGSQTGGAPQTSGTTQTFGLLRLQGTSFTSALDFGTNGGNYAWIQSTDQTNLATNYSLVLNPNGGNVGIGTTSPATRLQVNGQTRVSDGTTNIDIVCASSTGFIGTQTNAPLVLRTNDIERARIDSSGNVGIGTSSPGARLFVAQGSAQSPATSGNMTTGMVAGSSTAGEALNIGTDADGVWYNAAYANNAGVARIHRWLTGGTERARIDSSGYFKASNTGTYTYTATTNEFRQSASSEVLVLTNSNASPNGQQIYHVTDANNTSNTFLFCYAGATTRATIRCNGGIANFQANNVNLSDRREKTNFAPAGEYLSKICAIPVQTFNYIDQNMEDDPGLTLGVVAQDVQAVAPELVMESNWGTEEEPKMRLSIYQTDLQYALMKCIQEQQAIIDAQQAALNQLKADVAALKGTA